MQISATILLLAIVVEQVTNIIKSALPAIRDEWSRVSAIFVGIILCFATRIGILADLNVPVVYPAVDYIITGLLISRGSNFVHDMFEGVNSYVQTRKR
ncbi:MAG: hypothetical protein FD169_452 [Bacillota bacterium]|nr:MAG: hypothetical protein FD169_452 [Bacillota bacterium]MBS3949291.1 hypothetical protein [Peptococcaceae bacterium]